MASLSEVRENPWWQAVRVFWETRLERGRPSPVFTKTATRTMTGSSPGMSLSMSAPSTLNFAKAFVEFKKYLMESRIIGKKNCITTVLPVLRSLAHAIKLIFWWYMIYGCKTKSHTSIMHSTDSTEFPKNEVKVKEWVKWDFLYTLVLDIKRKNNPW